MLTETLFAQFQRHLTLLGGEVVYVDDLAQAAQMIVERAKQADGSIVVPPISGAGAAGAETPLWQQIIPVLREKGITLKASSGPDSAADAPIGLSGAALAIAETGSVMLADNALAARVVSMLTLTHLILIAEHDIVPMLDDAGKRLQALTRLGPDQQRYISFVTGPSRTSDIERVLTIGVQGPTSLCVIVVKG